MSLSDQIGLRPALPQDLEYCKRIYFAEMDWIIQKLDLDRTRQAATFQDDWHAQQVRIVTLNGGDVGWLQTSVDGNDVFLRQIFVDSRFQRRGIGTEVIIRLIREAASENRSVVLHVVKINPALNLYQRLGFEIIREVDNKFQMKRAANVHGFLHT